MGKQFTLYSAEAYPELCQESKMKLFQSLIFFKPSKVKKLRYKLHKRT